MELLGVGFPRAPGAQPVFMSTHVVQLAVYDMLDAIRLAVDVCHTEDASTA